MVAFLICLSLFFLEFPVKLPFLLQFASLFSFLSRDVSIQSALKWKYSCQTLLEKLDGDLQKARETAEVNGNNVREVRLTIDMPSIHPVVAQEYKPFYHLPDTRIILAMAIGIIFLVIIIGVVYAALKAHEQNDSTAHQ